MIGHVWQKKCVRRAPWRAALSQDIKVQFAWEQVQLAEHRRVVLAAEC